MEMTNENLVLKPKLDARERKIIAMVVDALP